MDLWQGRLADFVNAATSGALAGDMTGQFVKKHNRLPGSSEVTSWKNSLDAMARLLDGTRLTDVGVTVAAGAGAEPPPGALAVAQEPDAEVGICTEYHLPYSSKRIDVMLFGADASGNANSLVIELKQWSKVQLTDEYAINVLLGDQEHPHPSQQALDYADYLSGYHDAFVDGGIRALPAAWCHGMTHAQAEPLRDPRFASLVERSPLFTKDDEPALGDVLADRLAGGRGMDIMAAVTGGKFKPSKQVIESLEAVLKHEEEWHLLDAQRVAHGAILAEVRRLQARKGRKAVLVRGGPGTGKTVIAVQLLADALRLGLKAVHSTGGKAFTTALRSRFKGASDLFMWNMNLRKAPTQGIDLLLVDEAHRIRENSDTRYTRRDERNQKSQVQELVDSAKVTVFFLDENQFMRPDEIGTTAVITETAGQLEVPLKTYDLQTQFRCGGCEEYVAWVDHVLGFRDEPLGPWGEGYDTNMLDEPAQLEELLTAATDAGERARLVAGFCWKWSNQNDDGSLESDVTIGDWSRPWNAKPNSKKSYRPDNHPYTLWATTEAGLGEVGCIYSAQGFEFDRVGVIWGEDLVWRTDRWIAQKEGSFDRPVRSSEKMLDLVRNAYRVLLTRGIRGTSILCLDPETREHVAATLEAVG